jgi:hypothetical protein
MLVDIVTLPYLLLGKFHDCLASCYHRNVLIGCLSVVLADLMYPIRRDPPPSKCLVRHTQSSLDISLRTSLIRTFPLNLSHISVSIQSLTKCRPKLTTS